MGNVWIHGTIAVHFNEVMVPGGAALTATNKPIKEVGPLTTTAIPVERIPVRSLPFTQQRGFRKTLYERVDAHLRDNKIPARDVPAMYVKTAVSLAWWLAAYLLLLLGHFPMPVNIVVLLVWAMAIGGIGFNVMHDANHRGYSNHPWVNKVMSLSAELLGMSGFRWRTKHNVWHHTYTNIAGFDDDIETYGTMRLTPRLPWKPLYRFQPWYFPLVYAGTAFDFIARDFMMAIIGKSDANHVYPKMSTGDKVTFWGGKLFWILIMFAIPMLVYPWWQVVLGFVLVMLLIGVVFGLVFQLAHIDTNAEFPEPVGDPAHIENEWAIHQVRTTVDFAPRNKLLNLYIGGLNYQVEHHLLPHICHMNYPRLAPIVAQTCADFGLPYNCHATWRAAFVSHWRLLRRMAQPDEATSQSAG
jgi:linoleoyl-CoA desaturase